MTEKNNRFNAKTAREQFSGKLEANMGTVQRYLTIGMDKWIGDCDGMIPITFVYFTEIFYHLILYLLNIRTNDSL